jgi:hypothetical protein
MLATSAGGVSPGCRQANSGKPSIALVARVDVERVKPAGDTGRYAD